MADRSLIGATYRFSWLVERGKILELVDAIGDEDPIYRDREAAQAEGYQDIVASPTFTTVPIMWSGVLFKVFDDLSIPLSRIMHAEQGYEYYRDILPGDTISGVMEVKSITEREGRTGAMDFVLFEIRFTNQHEEPVVKEELLVVERK